MRPTTIANFEKELIQHFQMGYEIPKTEINQIIGEGRGSTNIMKERSRGYMAIICKNCGSIYPIKMKTNLNWNITSESDFETHFNAHVHFRGRCQECRMEHENFTITYRDFAPTISILHAKGYNTSIEYDGENDQFKLKIHSAGDGNIYTKNILRQCLKLIVPSIPITWSYEIDYQNTELTLILDRCNYIEGIYDIQQFIRLIPLYEYEYEKMTVTYRSKSLKHLYEMNKILSHPYIF